MCTLPHEVYKVSSYITSLGFEWNTKTRIIHNSHHRMRRLSPCNNYDLGHTRVYWIRRITIIYMIYQIQISNRVQRMIRYNEQMGSACSFNLIKTHVDLPNEPEAHETVTVTGTQLFSIQHGYRDSCTRRRSLPISGRGSSFWELEDGLAGKGAINMHCRVPCWYFCLRETCIDNNFQKQGSPVR